MAGSDVEVSVIMPAYNTCAYIEKAIMSVMEQDSHRWELIIVEDKSSDDTLNIVKRYAEIDKRIKVIQNVTNVGAAGSRNIGIDASQGRYLCFIDSDDLWSSDKLSIQLNHMRSTGSAFSCSSYIFIDSKGVKTGNIVRVPARASYNNLLHHSTVWTSTVMIDTDSLSKEFVKMPDTLGEDTLTWWRLAKEAGYVSGIDRVLAMYRRHGGSLSSNKIAMVRARWYMYRRYERLSIFYSVYCMVSYSLSAVSRRI